MHSTAPMHGQRNATWGPLREQEQDANLTGRPQQQSGTGDKIFKQRPAENRSRGVRRRWTNRELMLAIHWCGYHVVTVHSGFGLTDGATGFASRNLQSEIANLWFVLSI